MNTNSPYSLDAESKLQLEQIAAKKPSLAKRLIGFVFFIGIAYAAYAYRDDLVALVKKPAATDASANTADAGGGRGGRGGGGGRGGRGNAVVSVVAIAAKTVDMPVYLRGLGTVTPYANVTVRSRVDGQLTSVKFEEGQLVIQGALLATIDKRPFEVQLAQGKAQLGQAQGNLARDEALLKSAKTEFERDQDLLRRGLIPKQTVDIQSASVDQYTGSILADHAAMDNAQAAIANANLQIVYSEITSPITGRMGLRLVDPGNIVHASDPSGLVVIAEVQPITVVFNLPEDDIGKIMKKIQAGQKLRVDAYDRDDTTRLATGSLLAVDNQIDQTTGTSRLKAIFDNKNDALFPNQFVNVHLLVEIQKGATVIPAAAVQRGPQGSYVFVVDNGRAKIRPVSVKTTQGNDVALGPELKAGEIVVIEGTDKTQDNGRVDAQMADASGHDPTPTMVADDATGGGGGRRGGGGGKGDGGSGGRGGRGGNGRGGRGQRNGSQE